MKVFVEYEINKRFDVFVLYIVKRKPQKTKKKPKKFQ